ncbi:hypothetical protein ACH40E_40430 [Streptomyces acidicola]|uniref:Uncharacterized protein n=1 Tax=Streptomyces acidicola TaxID=2596892 RepID=A0A5N8WRL2_9ACTN|nr:hypothetical protein [Streptomyces acidicola]MPY50051.1 hypothetical protein [Streptomyces acidicola]
MSARTHTRPHPATTGGVGVRLPWWAFVLPMLAFVALLLMILNPSDAQAATTDPALTHLFELIQQALLHGMP